MNMKATKAVSLYQGEGHGGKEGEAEPRRPGDAGAPDLRSSVSYLQLSNLYMCTHEIGDAARREQGYAYAPVRTRCPADGAWWIGLAWGMAMGRVLAPYSADD